MIIVYLILGLTLLLLTRLCYLLPFTNLAKLRKQVKSNQRLMVLLGSGGHTGEMLRIVENLDDKKIKLINWIITEGDEGSILKAQEFKTEASTEILILPRARKVGQSYFSSIFSTIHCLLKTFQLLVSRQLPSLVLCNGPGTSVPLCYMVVLLNFVSRRTVMIYIESLARVETLSLSGKLLYPIVDRFIVQWEKLQSFRAEYYGIMV